MSSSEEIADSCMFHTQNLDEASLALLYESSSVLSESTSSANPILPARGLVTLHVTQKVPYCFLDLRASLNDACRILRQQNSNPLLTSRRQWGHAEIQRPAPLELLFLWCLPISLVSSHTEKQRLAPLLFLLYWLLPISLVSPLSGSCSLTLVLQYVDMEKVRI